MKYLLTCLLFSLGSIILIGQGSNELDSLKNLEITLENDKKNIELKIKEIKQRIETIKLSGNVQELDPNKYYAITTEQVTYDAGNFYFKKIPKGITVEVRSYDSSKGRFFIVRQDNFDSGHQSGKGLSKIGNKDYNEVKNKIIAEANDPCKLIKDEYDPFDKVQHSLTNSFEVLKKSDESWSASLNVRLGKRGNSAHIKFNAGSVECITSASTVEILLDNDQRLKFHHKYDIDCGKNIWITANLTTSEINNFKTYNISAAKINGSEYYANFIHPIDDSKGKFKLMASCLGL